MAAAILTGDAGTDDDDGGARVGSHEMKEREKRREIGLEKQELRVSVCF